MPWEFPGIHDGAAHIQLHIHIGSSSSHHDAKAAPFFSAALLSLCSEGRIQIIHTLGMVHRHRKTVAAAIQLAAAALR